MPTPSMASALYSNRPARRITRRSHNGRKEPATAATAETLYKIQRDWLFCSQLFVFRYFFMIKEIISDNELFDSVNVITQSFKTVADEFNLTKNNCPTHPSLITYDKLLELKNKGLLFFGLFINNIQIGFIALEKANADLFYIEKLSISPQHRHKSYGKKLLDFAIEYIKKLNGKMISIGIINDQIVLKKWYNTFGFHEIMTKEYDHLPFKVCFMEKIL